MTTVLIITAILLAAFIIRKSNRKPVVAPKTQVESWVLVGKNMDTNKNEIIYADPRESKVRNYYNREVTGFGGYLTLSYTNFKIEKRVTVLN